MLVNKLLTTLFLFTVTTLWAVHAAPPTSYDDARWDPIHFSPAIESATNEQCLACHREIMEATPLEQSPAGVARSDVLAWYQTISLYAGEQETFHRRHLETPLAKELMNLQCNTCHQGHNPREEAPIPPTDSAAYTLRKSVDPDTCLLCHGQFNAPIMGVPGSWQEFGHLFQNDCMICHAAIRTTRHQVNYLHDEAIEQAAKENPETCYSCHGGRSWYRIPYPYPRNEWPGMTPAPEWAKDRPTQSQSRFLR